MKFTLGKKMQMTQIWVNDKVQAVTPVLAGPCVITQVKTVDKDKYSAVQLAFGSRKDKNIKKPQLGHFKKAGVSPMHVREFRTENDLEVKVGDVISLNTFTAGDVIDVTGTSKGRGFQGVVKRHGFKGGNKSHGNKDQLRMPGSIGPMGPAHVFKGMKMGGRMGNERVTVSNLTISSIDLENNIIYIKGAVPGAIDGLLLIKSKGELVVEAPEEKSVVEEKIEVSEDAKVENKPEEKKTEEVKIEKSKEAESVVEDIKAEPLKEVKENKEEAPAA